MDIHRGRTTKIRDCNAAKYYVRILLGNTNVDFHLSNHGEPHDAGRLELAMSKLMSSSHLPGIV